MSTKRWLLRHSAALLILHVFVQLTIQDDGVVVVQSGRSDDAATPASEKGDPIPHFGTENSTVFVFPAGSTALLPCVIYNLGKHVVTWSRLKDYQLLIIYNRSYTTDERVHIAHSEDLQNWTLKINHVKKSDAGFYSCQIPTMSPPQSIFMKLQIIDRQSKKTLENPSVPKGGKVAPSFYSENGTLIKVQEGSTGLLSCVVRNVGAYKVVWSRIKDNHILAVHNTTVVLDFRIQGLYLQSSENWILQIRDVEVKDSGWYKCEVSTTPAMSIFVELLVEDLERFPPNGDNATQLAQPVSASFGTPNGTFVTFQVGSVALLPCLVYNLGEGVVSWIRHRDYHIVTIGELTYTNDDRFQVVHLEDSETWSLRIKYVVTRDAGLYRCQVSSHPTTSIFIQLNVVEAKAEIVGSPEKYLKLGSRLELDCYMVESTETPIYVFWYHYERMINYDTDRGVNVTTDLSAKTSTLSIEMAATKHSGNYTCSPSNAQPARVFVHVLKGENPAAMQHGTATLSSKSLVWWTVFCVVEVVTFL